MEFLRGEKNTRRNNQWPRIRFHSSLKCEYKAIGMAMKKKRNTKRMTTAGMLQTSRGMHMKY